MKRVFSYDKWASDPTVVEFLEKINPEGDDLTLGSTQYIDDMRGLDGEEVKMVSTDVGYVGDKVVHVDWTTEKDSILADIIMVVGGALAVYGLAMLCQSLKDLLCSMM